MYRFDSLPAARVLALLVAVLAAPLPAGADDDNDPAAAARESSKAGEEELAASRKGVDEDGEKLWMQEARDFFDRAKNPKNRTFELPWKWAREMTGKFYKAGATKVWITSISEFEIGDAKLFVSDDMVIVLPTDPEKRKSVLAVYNAWAKEVEETTLADVGQKYIHIVGD